MAEVQQLRQDQKQAYSEAYHLTICQALGGLLLKIILM